ncbi:MAG TPA: SdrD B-like domain-containing protein [Bacteroidota bacterium]|nr:SdrD B-like domain-containing protein [Bacteroidota bacterium]
MNIRDHLLRRCAFFGLMMIAASAVDAQSKFWRERFESVGYNVAINPLNPNTIYAEDRQGVLNVSRDKGKTWTQLNPVPGPFRGMRNILVHPRDTLTIFVLRDQGGMWRTTNGGQSWNDVLPNFGIDGESIDFDKQHPDTMFAGDFFTTNVYRSLDRGNSWTIQSTIGTMVCGLTVRPDSGNIILAGTGNGTLSKSTDWGVTWRQVYNAGTNEVPKIVFNPSHPRIGYANVFVDFPPETNCGLIKTTDGGDSWSRTPILRDTSLWSIVLDEAHPETVYVGRFSSNGYGIDRTTDGGLTYQHFQDGIKIDLSGGYSGFSAWNLKLNPLAFKDLWLAGSTNSFSPKWPGAVYHFVDGSTTVVQGTVRDSATNNPISATMSIATTFEMVNVSGNFSFNYYQDDPTLTPTVHVTSPTYYPKDTTLTFVVGTTQNQDIRLQALPFTYINGGVFNDANGNGLRDNGEPGLPNRLLRLSGGKTDSTLTDANGHYSFDSLAPGTYTVSERVDPGYVQTSPCAGTYTLTVTQNSILDGNDFGNQVDAPPVPGTTLLTEDFGNTNFPPPCWSIENVNGGFTWVRDAFAFSSPASALCGSTNLGDGSADDWLDSRPVRLQCGRIYRLSWYDRTSSTVTPFDSLAVAIGLAPTATAMGTIINNRAFNTNFNWEYVEQEFSVPIDSFYYIGFHDYSAAGARLRIDDVMLVYVRPGAGGSISGMKFQDLNNNGVKDPLEPAIPYWKIRLTGTRTASTLTDANGNYIFTCLAAGGYTITEDSKAGWVRTYPVSGSYSITLASGDSSKGNDFGNFQPNSITVRKFQDNDGSFSTSLDRTATGWHLEVRSGSVSGPTVASGDAVSVTANNLTDGTYVAFEAGVAGWTRLGYVLYGLSVASTDSAVGLSVAGGQIDTVDFVNASDQIYQHYRTALYDEWASSVDRKGKSKSIKRKPDRVFFKLNIGAPSAATGFTLKFNMPSNGITTVGKLKADTLAPTTPWDSVKTVAYHTVSPIALGDSFQIDGRGFMGKKFEVSVTWATSPTPITLKYSKNAPGWKRNDPSLPLPNLHNVGEELFPKGFGQGSGTFFSGVSPLVIGVPRGPKGAGSVKLATYANVLKSLIVPRTSMKHTLGPKCLNRFDTNDSMKSQLTSLPPNKQSNVLFGELLALKLNIAASATNKFPNGLGELTFSDPNDPTNPFNGQRVDTICRKADSLLSCLTLQSKIGSADFNAVLEVIHRIDSAFTDGTIDTISFAAKTSLSGVRRLADVPYLHPTPGAVPANFTSSPVDQSSLPRMSELYQNYPNPFNPTTTIQFDLADPARVTLKVYNVLGQVVATLLDHQNMDDGAQEVEFDGNRLSSGVYFYQLITETLSDPEEGTAGLWIVSVKKMLLLK